VEDAMASHRYSIRKEHKDMEKHKFAIDRGYEILEVWDTDDVDKALQFCFERIMS
jgi:hypothetical protein